MNKIDIHKRLTFIGLRTAVVLTFLSLWELCAIYKMLDPFYTSQPTMIYRDIKEFYASGALVKHTSITLQEAFLGLVCGIFFGITVGFLLGRINFLGKVFEPLITALYGIPKLALAPIFILWFGLGMESKIVLSGLMVFYLVFFSAYGGIKSVDPNLVGAAKLMGASEMQIMVKVVMPSCVPWILAGVRGGVGASLIGAIVGEYMGATAGLGWMIAYATSFFQIERVMSSIIVLFLVGIFFSHGLKILEKHLLRWRPPVDYGASSEGVV